MSNTATSRIEEPRSGHWCASPATAIATVYLRTCWREPDCDTCRFAGKPRCTPKCQCIGAENNMHPTDWQPTDRLLWRAVNALKPEVIVTLLDTHGGAFDEAHCETQREGG